MTGILWDVEQERRELGRRVEQARLAHGWSKERAAREAGISAITWKRIEDGLGVHDEKRYAVLRVLGMHEQPPRAPDAVLAAAMQAGLSPDTIQHIREAIDADLAARGGDGDGEAASIVTK